MIWVVFLARRRFEVDINVHLGGAGEREKTAAVGFGLCEWETAGLWGRLKHSVWPSLGF